MLGKKQLEIHGKWWYHFYACFWVYLDVRTCDVFSLVCYLILGFGSIVSWLLVFFDKPVVTPSKNKRVCNVCISISEWSVALIITLLTPNIAKKVVQVIVC